MKTSWTIDDHLIEIAPKPGAVELFIDEQRIAGVPDNLLARYPIPWRKREVELRRVRNLDVAKSELWVNGIRCPPDEPGPGPPAEAPRRRRCRAHGRDPVRRCRRCGEACCDRCLSVDGVRCQACFDKAAAVARASDRRGRLIGLGLGFGLGSLALLIALAGGASVFAKLGGALLGLSIFWLIRGLYQQRRRDKQQLGVVPLPVALTDEAPAQLVGRRCARCAEPIALQREAAWCAECRSVLHKKCRKQHACEPPAGGPDWWAMRSPNP